MAEALFLLLISMLVGTAYPLPFSRENARAVVSLDDGAIVLSTTPAGGVFNNVFADRISTNGSMLWRVVLSDIQQEEQDPIGEPVICLNGAQSYAYAVWSIHDEVTKTAVPQVAKIFTSNGTVEWMVTFNSSLLQPPRPIYVYGVYFNDVKDSITVSGWTLGCYQASVNCTVNHHNLFFTSLSSQGVPFNTAQILVSRLHEKSQNRVPETMLVLAADSESALLALETRQGSLIAARVKISGVTATPYWVLFLGDNVFDKSPSDPQATITNLNATTCVSVSNGRRQQQIVFIDKVTGRVTLRANISVPRPSTLLAIGIPSNASFLYTIHSELDAYRMYYRHVDTPERHFASQILQRKQLVNPAGEAIDSRAVVTMDFSTSGDIMYMILQTLTDQQRVLFGKRLLCESASLYLALNQTCVACPSQLLTNSTSAGLACQICAPGYTHTDANNNCTLCPGGYACSGLTPFPEVCGPGFLCTAGSDSALFCPFGKFCPDPSTSILCPAGAYCPSGATAAVQCPRGFYCPVPGLVTPVRCPPQCACGVLGADSPTACLDEADVQQIGILLLASILVPCGLMLVLVSYGRRASVKRPSTPRLLTRMFMVFGFLIDFCLDILTLYEISLNSTAWMYIGICIFVMSSLVSAWFSLVKIKPMGHALTDILLGLTMLAIPVATVKVLFHVDSPVNSPVGSPKHTLHNSRHPTKQQVKQMQVNEYKLLEATFEAAPQLVFQSSVVLSLQAATWLLTLSVSTSLFVIALTMTTLHFNEARKGETGWRHFDLQLATAIAHYICEITQIVVTYLLLIQLLGTMAIPVAGGIFLLHALIFRKFLSFTPDGLLLAATSVLAFFVHRSALTTPNVYQFTSVTDPNTGRTRRARTLAAGMPLDMPSYRLYLGLHALLLGWIGFLIFAEQSRDDILLHVFIVAVCAFVCLFITGLYLQVCTSPKQPQPPEPPQIPTSSSRATISLEMPPRSTQAEGDTSTQAEGLPTTLAP